MAPTSQGVWGRWGAVEGNSSQNTISLQGQDLTTARGNLKDKQVISNVFLTINDAFLS